jgi:uncharacterized protein YjaZ
VYNKDTVFLQNFPPSERLDLTEYMVMEGRADSFARMLNPKIEPPWTKALTPEQEAAQWQAMQGYLTSREPSMADLIFGDGESIPEWTGYTIGSHIVQKYIQTHPDSSVEEWIRLDAHELLKESGYTGQP